MAVSGDVFVRHKEGGKGDAAEVWWGNSEAREAAQHRPELLTVMTWSKMWIVSQLRNPDSGCHRLKCPLPLS